MLKIITATHKFFSQKYSTIFVILSELFIVKYQEEGQI